MASFGFSSSVRFCSPGRAAGRRMQCTPTKAGSQRGIKLQFSIPYRCEFGQRLAVIGSIPSLGEWDPSAALPMTWHEGDVWCASCSWSEDAGGHVEYKYVVQNGDLSVAHWKPGENCKVHVDAAPGLALAHAHDDWATNRQVVRLLVDSPTTAPAPVKLRRPKGSLGVITKELDVAFQRLEHAVVAGEGAVRKEGCNAGAPEAFQADADVARAFQLTVALMRAEEAIMQLQTRPALGSPTSSRKRRST